MDGCMILKINNPVPIAKTFPIVKHMKKIIWYNNHQVQINKIGKENGST